MGIEPPTALLVLENVLVDRLMADREGSVAFQMGRNLFGAPLLLKVVGDQAPTVLGEVSSTAGATSAGGGIAMGNLRPVDAVMGVRVSLAFAADG